MFINGLPLCSFTFSKNVSVQNLRNEICNWTGYVYVNLYFHEYSYRNRISVQIGIYVSLFKYYDEYLTLYIL